MAQDFDQAYEQSVERSRARDDAPNRPAGHRRQGGRGKAGRRKRILKWTAIGVSCTVVATALGGYIYLKVLDSNIHAEPLHSGGVAPSVVAEKSSGGNTPINVLVIGSDSRSSAEDLSLGGSRDSVGGPAHADVEMLVHISADRTNASITSIPRDTWVQPYACQGKKLGRRKITETLGSGGPSCVVDTWESLTHIQIDHFVMLDFAGVVKMADAVGGVQVCTQQNVADYHPYIDPTDGSRHEEGSDLVLPAGTHTIYGVQALEWLRTRHAWEDGTDIGRTKAQHLYLNSMIRKMKSANTLLDPLKLNSLAQAATSALTVDPGLKSIEAMSSLALDFNKIPPSRVTTVTIPFDHLALNPRDPNNWVPALNADSDKVFSMIANDVPLDKNGTSPTPTVSPSPSTAAPSTTPVDKASVRIAVQNASVDGRGKAMADHLVAAGFTKAVRDTRTVTGATQLSYPAADQAQALAVAAELGLTASTLKEDASATGLVLRIGSEWTSGFDYRTTLPKQGAVPTTAITQNAQADSNQCMEVYAPYRWKTSTPPNVPQPAGYQPYTTP